MAAYTTPDQVRSLMGPDFDASIDLSGYIGLAHVLVAKWCPSAFDVPDGYTGDELEMIERAVAAHVITISPAARAAGAESPIRERAGEVEEEYNRRVLGTGLESTEWGRLAMVLDWRGFLAALNNKMKAVSMQVPAGKKQLTAGKNIAGGPDLPWPYRPNDARFY